MVPFSKGQILSSFYSYPSGGEWTCELPIRRRRYRPCRYGCSAATVAASGVAAVAASTISTAFKKKLTLHLDAEVRVRSRVGNFLLAIHLIISVKFNGFCPHVISIDLSFWRKLSNELFRGIFASLYEAASIRPSIGPSVGPSAVHPSTRPSVHAPRFIRK